MAGKPVLSSSHHAEVVRLAPGKLQRKAAAASVLLTSYEMFRAAFSRYSAANWWGRARPRPSGTGCGKPGPALETSPADEWFSWPRSILDHPRPGASWGETGSVIRACSPCTAAFECSATIDRCPLTGNEPRRPRPYSSIVTSRPARVTPRRTGHHVGIGNDSPRRYSRTRYVSSDRPPELHLSPNEGPMTATRSRVRGSTPDPAKPGHLLERPIEVVVQKNRA